MTVKECYAAMGGDYENVLSRLRTDERIVRFLGKVAEDKSIELLCSSLDARNMEEAFRAAHTLKGVSMNLSLTALYESSEKITEALRGRTEYGDDIEPLLRDVKACFEHTVQCIKSITA